MLDGFFICRQKVNFFVKINKNLWQNLIFQRGQKKAQFSPIRKFVPLLEKVKKREIEVFELHIG